MTKGRGQVAQWSMLAPIETSLRKCDGWGPTMARGGFNVGEDGPWSPPVAGPGSEIRQGSAIRQILAAGC